MARRVGVLVLSALAAGCAYPISKELRSKAAPNLTFPMVLKNPDAYRGSVVIWGGHIIETLNRKDGTEFVVLETPLDSSGMPLEARYSRGRFIARTPEFFDPEVYRKGARVTIGGEISARETRPLGEIQYTYPVIAIRELYLWDEPRPEWRCRCYYTWPGPYYSWGWGYWWY